MGAVVKGITSILGGGTPKAAKPPAPVTPPPAATPPTLADASQAGNVGANAGKALAGAAYGGTIMTSPRGLTQKAPTAATSLLGGTE